jgi:hypothetical protein
MLCTLKSRKELKQTPFPNLVGIVVFNLRYAYHGCTTNKQTPWSESASELHRLSDRRLLAK